MNRRAAIAALVSLPATAVITRAAVKSTDVIVIETDEHLSQDAVVRIQRVMNEVWPGQKVVVLPGGLKMRIAQS